MRRIVVEPEPVDRTADMSEVVGLLIRRHRLGQGGRIAAQQLRIREGAVPIDVVSLRRRYIRKLAARRPGRLAIVNRAE
jgi:hypothetical protein